MINIKFPDGNVKQYESGITPLQIAESISSGLARNILAASVNDQEWDISRPICNDGEIKLFKWEDAEGKHAFWHTSAHLLAEALQELYPGVQFGIGPAIENGFYYDIDPGEHTITSADFPKIEKKMRELADRKFDEGNFECGIAEVLVNLGILMDAGFEQKDALKILGIGAEIRKAYVGETAIFDGVPLFHATDEEAFRVELSTKEDKPVQICADEGNPVYATTPMHNPVELCTHEGQSIEIKASEFFMDCTTTLDDVTSYECQQGCISCCADNEEDDATDNEDNDVADAVEDPESQFSAFVTEYALSDKDAEQLHNALETLRKRQSYSDYAFIELKESGKVVEIHWGQNNITGDRALIYYMIVSVGDAHRKLLKIMHDEGINDVVTRASVFGVLQKVYNERNNPDKVYKTPIGKNKVIVMTWQDRDTLDVYLENKEA